MGDYTTELLHLFQRQMKEEVVQDLLAIKDELLAPFAGLTGIADKFIDQYNKVFSVVKSIKNAYSTLKKGYVRSL
jgi:hypothetical protein